MKNQLKVHFSPSWALTQEMLKTNPQAMKIKSDSFRVGRNKWERGRDKNIRGKERFNGERKFTNAF